MAGAESTATMAGGAEVEAANRNELLRKLPAELWSKIVDENVQQNDLLALAMTCRFFREKQKDLGKKLETNLRGRMSSHTLGWFRWVCDTFEILPDLKNYAAFQGSVEILRWLMEERGGIRAEHASGRGWAAALRFWSTFWGRDTCSMR